MTPPILSGRWHGFQNTSWTLVVEANKVDSVQAQEALSRLCKIYWYPIYAFIRRRGNDGETAKDLTQEFFARLLAKEYLATANQEKGRFRNFIISCVDRFLKNEFKRNNTLKRGGQITFVPISLDTAEGFYQAEPMHSLTPIKLLERKWALDLLRRCLDQLKEDYEAMGKGKQFDVLNDFLASAKDAEYSYAEAGAKLGLSEEAVRKAVSRMRIRFGALLRSNVAETVNGPAELEGELNYLMAVLSEPNS